MQSDAGGKQLDGADRKGLLATGVGAGRQLDAERTPVDRPSALGLSQLELVATSAVAHAL
jgi:hypothetical protein